MNKKAIAVLPDFAVRGITFDNRQQIIAELEENMLLELSPEPENPYDPNAVAILFEGEKIGYIPREYSAYISSLLQQGIKLYITVLRIIEKITPERKLRIPIVLVYQIIDEPEIYQIKLEGGEK